MAKVNKGFSLVELSIVLVIIGVLVTVSLTLGRGQIDVANIKTTQAKLDRIDQAMATYLKTNGALPCPAAGTAALINIGAAGNLTTSTANQSANISNLINSYPFALQVQTVGFNDVFNVGDTVFIKGVNGTNEINGQSYTIVGSGYQWNLKDAGGNYITANGWGAYVSGGVILRGYAPATCAGFNYSGTNHYVGIVPVRTLGLSDDYAFDAWGNRITYAVSKPCVDPVNWNVNNTFKCAGYGPTLIDDGGKIIINDLSANNGAAKITDAAYVTLSLGKDGYGAYSRSNVRQAAAPNPATAALKYYKEYYNSGGEAVPYSSGIFNDGFINDGSTPNNYFDDIIHWKTAPMIWDDAYSAILPSCAVGQILISNGGSSYRCDDDSGVIYTDTHQTSGGPANSHTAADPVKYTYPLANSSGLDTSATNTYALTNPLLSKARYFYISGTCNVTGWIGGAAANASTLPYAYVTYQIYSSPTVFTTGKVCETHNLNKSVANVNVNTDMAFVRIPKGTVKIAVTMDYLYDSNAIPTQYTINFFK